jgi:ArsR family transcriptional regulator
MDIDATQLFRILGDQTRLRALMLLLQSGELCVCELTYALELSQPKISRHLGVLREAGLVLDRRAGTWIHYRLAEDLPDWVFAILQQALTGTSHEAVFNRDIDKLNNMPDRPGSACCA